MRSVSTSKAPSTTITAGDEHACSKPSSGLEPRNARYFGGDSSSLLGGGQLQERLGSGPNGWAEPGAAEQAFVVSADGLLDTPALILPPHAQPGSSRHGQLAQYSADVSYEIVQGVPYVIRCRTVHHMKSL